MRPPGEVERRAHPGVHAWISRFNLCRGLHHAPGLAEQRPQCIHGVAAGVHQGATAERVLAPDIPGRDELAGNLEAGLGGHDRAD